MPHNPLLITPDASPITGRRPQVAGRAWRIRVIFAGNLPPRFYITPDVRYANPGWDSEVFNRQIESVEFFLPTGHVILLSGMEAYNFFVEATQAFSTRGGARIEAFWLCGKLPTHNPQPFTLHSSPVEMWRIGQGKVIRRRKPWGKEWGGAAIRGWKFGRVGARPTSTILTSEASSVISPPFSKGGSRGIS